MEILEKAAKILEECYLPTCHSHFQIKNFIIGKESSRIGKIWQAVREIQSRKESLVNLANDLEELKDNIDLAKLDIEEEKLLEINDENPDLKAISSERKNINIRKKERALKKLYVSQQNLFTQRNNLADELAVFVEIFDSFGGIDAFKNYNEEESQIEYWRGKFEKEFILSNILGQPLSPEFIKSILAFAENGKISENIGAALDIINKKLLNKNN